MARAGLGARWKCVFSNDNDPQKIKAYQDNWPSDHLVQADIANVPESLVPDDLILAWASSPCQNFSSAGLGDGLLGSSSSAFIKWWELIERKVSLNSSPKIIVLENVVGLLKSREGLDFAFICDCFSKSGFSFGVVLIDAIHFLPQSRPRIFIVAVRSEYNIPGFLVSERPLTPWHPSYLVKAVQTLPDHLKKKHIWWSLPKCMERELNLLDILSPDSSDLIWHPALDTSKLLQSMTQINLEKIYAAKHSGGLVVGTLFRRMRTIEGVRSSRAEVRFDGVAGCLRASTGGSSRQILLFVEGQNIRTRHMTPRESARLMGLPDSYALPLLKTHAVKLVGDGVAVPVVNFLSEYLLAPLAQAVNLKPEVVSHAFHNPPDLASATCPA